MPISLQKLLSSESLPSLPEVAMRVVRLAQEPEPDFDELTHVIKADPAISARVLRTVNSALFGLRQRVTSIESAIPILGVTMIRTLVLSFSLADYRGPSARHRVYFQRLWRGSVTQAVTAEMLAERNPEIDPSTWFLAALLQDIGRLSILAAEPDEYSRIIGLVDDGPEMLEHERRVFGFTHADVSVQMCLRWRIDEPVIDAIARHHVWIYKPAPTREREASPEHSDLAIALRCAAMTADYLEGLRAGRKVDRTILQNAFRQGFEVANEELDELLTDIDHRVSEIASLFMFDIGEFTAVEDLLAQAQSTLARIAVDSQLEVTTARRHIQEAQRELASIRTTTDELREQAQRDPLTGATTRRFLESAITQELQRCERNGRRLGMLFMDVDKFKGINDTYGHGLGDEVLQHLVRAVRSSIRDSDTVIRFGGDEFVVMFSLASNSTLSRVAERIRSRVADIAFIDYPNVHVSSSIGALLYQPGPKGSTSVQRLLDEADHAMYIAKQRGGNQYALFTLKGDAAEALEVEYRPRQPLADDDVWAAEAAAT